MYSININLIIIGITVLVSIVGFGQKKVFQNLSFHIGYIMYRRQWYRMFTYALLHGDWGHLFINMWVLWVFGTNVEQQLEYHCHWGNISDWIYLLFYIVSIGFSTLYDLYKHKDNPDYVAIGASGAVSAVVFASIVFNPMDKMIIFPIPIPMPGFVFGILYLAYSVYMSRKNVDNIGHATHFWGGVFGAAFALIIRLLN